MPQNIAYIKGDDTLEFLQRISRRLSGRNDCKNLEFEVHISRDNKSSMIPLVYVFPDTHHRAEIDKLIITEYVRQQMLICNLSPGVYKYQKVDTPSRKNRRWIRMM